MSRRLPAEDLLVLARQCKLSDEEERRFELSLASSRELECLYDAGVRFDDEAALLSGDETRFARLVERTLERLDQADGLSTPRAAHPAPRRASHSSRAWLIARYFAASLGLGLLLCVTLASAWDYVEKRAAQQAQQALQRSAGDPGSRKPRPPAATPAPTPVPQADTENPLTDSAPVVPHSAAAASGQAHKATADEPLSPGELFARANQARRKGDIEEAGSLYERLGRAYPSSVEAEDAKVLRGNLLLSQRSPRAALRQFEEYPSGALSLEALWGRAQALRQLESPNERLILDELIREYPGSPYAEAAEKRLRELAR